MKTYNKNTIIYDIISIIAIIIYAISYIVNIGWTRMILSLFAPALCAILFVGCHLASKNTNKSCIRKFAILAYTAFIIGQLILVDYDDNNTYMFFRTIYDTPFWFNALTYIIAALLIVLNIVIFVNQIIMYAKYRSETGRLQTN